MIQRITAKEGLEDYNNFMCTFTTTPDIHSRMHTHEYYEIILILASGIDHMVNDAVIHLSKGDLIFVRPDDYHYLSNAKCRPFVTLSFSRELAHSAFAFLGNSFPASDLLNSPLPKNTRLSSDETTELYNTFLNFCSKDLKNKSARKLHFKSILISILTSHFNSFSYDDPRQDDQIPRWLINACNAMHEKQNFYRGIEAMVEASEKSYSHLSRALKHYYNQTVTEYINNIRLEYAKDLLERTDYPIIDIAFEAGFNTANWFNTCFKKKYGLPPNKIRK